MGIRPRSPDAGLAGGAGGGFSFAAQDLLVPKESADTDFDNMFDHRHTDHLAELTETVVGTMTHSPDLVAAAGQRMEGIDDDFELV